MLTKKTHDAIALLKGHSHERAQIQFTHYPNECDGLKMILMAGGLLDRFGHLTRPSNAISLLDILIALNEGIYPMNNSCMEERVYSRCSSASQTLGVVNHMLHALLSKITLCDLNTVSFSQK